ncbi:MAG: ThiF family adenylyltransferase [Methylacidiphilales bacterium]|nr:ThiF family adenylyltransferase [Candidatus Methylacidiphilales bacterium]
MPAPESLPCKYCLVRMTAVDRACLEPLLFCRYPYSEWGSFFFFGYRITPWGLHVTFVKALEPMVGDFDEKSHIVEFNPRYILRAQLAFESSSLGIGFIHSHPEDCGTSASVLDDDMDSYLSRTFGESAEGRPYVTLRVARDSAGRFSFDGEAWLGAEVMPVKTLLTTGAELKRESATLDGAARPSRGESPEVRSRYAKLIGAKVGKLSEARVAIAGCSGLGSPVAHVLVRAGVRKFVLVDPEFFAPSNLERMHGSTWSDNEALPTKVEILARLIHDIEPTAEVEMIRSNILHEDVLDRLLRCDLVLGCTDSQHSRAALGDFASHYLLPCIDAAVLMRAKEGKLTEQVGDIARYSPDEPCPWCLARIDPKILAYELMTPEERKLRSDAAVDAVRRGVDGAQYWGDAPPSELTVGYMTTTVGAMQAGYAQAWLTGTGSQPHQRFQFDLGMPFLGAVAVEKRRAPECSCNRTKGLADQARCDRSVTLPPHWQPPSLEPQFTKLPECFVRVITLRNANPQRDFIR